MVTQPTHFPLWWLRFLWEINVLNITSNIDYKTIELFSEEFFCKNIS